MKFTPSLFLSTKVQRTKEWKIKFENKAFSKKVCFTKPMQIIDFTREMYATKKNANGEICEKIRET